MEWNPNMGEAPKDGTEIILWDGFHNRATICIWHKDVGRWYIPSTGAHGAWFGKDIATHWLQLPAPPKDAA